jgi:hypothetical protein
MEICKKGLKNDRKTFTCRPCIQRKSIRFGSNLFTVTQSFQEIVRVIWYYFAKNYEPELAHREMTENNEEGSAAILSMSNVYSLYVVARDRISKH